MQSARPGVRFKYYSHLGRYHLDVILDGSLAEGDLVLIFTLLSFIVDAVNTNLLIIFLEGSHIFTGL